MAWCWCYLLVLSFGWVPTWVWGLLFWILLVGFGLFTVSVRGFTVYLGSLRWAWGFGFCVGLVRCVGLLVWMLCWIGNVGVCMAC